MLQITISLIILIHINNAQRGGGGGNINLNNLNNNQLQRLLERLTALTQDNIADAVDATIDGTVTDTIDPDALDIDIGPASLALRPPLTATIEPAFTSTTTATTTSFATTPTTTFDFQGNFFSTRFQQCESLKCGDQREDCCIDNVEAFCCPRQNSQETAEANEATEGRRFRRRNNVQNNVRNNVLAVDTLTPIDYYDGIASDYINAPLQDYAPLAYNGVEANYNAYTAYNGIDALLVQGQICLRDADCALGLLCEIDVNCLMNNSFGRRRRRRMRRRRRRRFNTICHKICTV